MQIIATSRPYFGMERAFQSLTDTASIIRINGEEETKSISQEINLVIKDKVGEIGHTSRLDESVRNSLEEKLLNTDHRTYLWLHLVLENFKEPFFTKAEVKKIIDTLPSTVSEAYSSILGKILPERREEAKRALHIIVAAERPLSLQEFNIALAMGESDYDKDSLPSEDAFKTKIRNLCGLFVTVIDEKVYLIHQTAKEYLINESGIYPKDESWEHSLIPMESSLVLFKACSSYLLSSTFRSHPLLLDNEC